MDLGNFCAYIYCVFGAFEQNNVGFYCKIELGLNLRLLYKLQVISEQKSMHLCSKIEPATEGDLLFGRGESLSGGSEGPTWEEVWEVWRRE